MVYSITDVPVRKTNNVKYQGTVIEKGRPEPIWNVGLKGVPELVETHVDVYVVPTGTQVTFG